MDNPDVLFIPELFPGSMRIRSQWPAEALRGVGISAWNLQSKLNEPIDLGRIESLRPKVVIVNLTAVPWKAKVVEFFMAHGSAVFVSEDDAVHWYPHRGSETAKKLTPEIKQATVEAAKMATGVIVTTDALAEHFGRWNANVHVVGNYLPAWVGDLEPLRSPYADDLPLVGFRGTVGGHMRDLEWIRPHAAAMLKGCRLVEVGGDGLVAEALDFKGPVHTYPWTQDPKALYQRMGMCDAAFVPLLPHRFNDAKSWLGGLEWATVGVPVVATATRDHVKLKALGMPRLEVVDTPEQMARSVRCFTSAPPYGSADDAPTRSLTLERNIGVWVDVLRPYL